jgi:hypothetical protein
MEDLNLVGGSELSSKSKCITIKAAIHIERPVFGKEQDSRQVEG